MWKRIKEIILNIFWFMFGVIWWSMLAFCVAVIGYFVFNALIDKPKTQIMVSPVCQGKIYKTEMLKCLRACNKNGGLTYLEVLDNKENKCLCKNGSTFFLNDLPEPKPLRQKKCHIKK